MMISAPQSATTRRILKALSVFGGVQVLTIICSIVRTKLVSIWIGPLGVGLISIYNTTIDLLSALWQLNLRQSAVRDISCASEPETLSRIAAIVRRLSLILGAIGTIVTCIISPLLGRWTFSDASHTVPFMILSPMILLSAICSGENAIMQGLERFKKLAKSTLYSSLTATAAAIPLFYFFRQNGIVPVLLIFAISNCAYALIFRVKEIPSIKISISEAFQKGRSMLALGFYITVSSVITLLASYIFIAWLNGRESTETVGIYQSGYTLINTYVGLLFTAIAMEYYPRLSATAHSPRRTSAIVAHEIKIALLVLIPVTVLFIMCKDLMISLLYSSKFEAAKPYVAIGIIGVSFRAASWCLAYVILARGDGKIYILSESISSVIYVIANILLFKHLQFIGLGIAYIIWFAAYLIVSYLIYRFRYGISLPKGIWYLLGLAICTGTGALIVDSNYGTLPTLIILIPAVLFSLRGIMNRRLPSA